MGPVAEQSLGASALLRENLALIYQEVLTVVTRLRAARQPVNNAEVFRAQIREALRVTEQQAAQRGYATEDIRLATFAVVALLDESVLSSGNPAFEGWLRRPMQEELFGVHAAGQIFFSNLERLLGMPETERLADVLEVYFTCMLLGFRGRYGAAGAESVRAVGAAVEDKLLRIRGPVQPPRLWALPSGETVKAPEPDPWTRRLMLSAMAVAFFALLLAVGFFFLLNGQVGDLRTLAGRLGA